MMIGVIGGESPPEWALVVAEDVGRELASRGCTVICGGLGGVMEAVCKGARETGGHTIGILPGSDPRAANDYVEFAIATGNGWGRALSLVHSSEAIIAVNGAYGTLAELAHALAERVPVIRLGGWELASQDHDPPPLIFAEDAASAAHLAVAAAEERRRAAS